MENTDTKEQNNTSLVDIVSTAIQVPGESTTTKETSDSTNTIVAKIRAAKELLDEGIITEEEFGEIKAKIITEM